MISTKFWFFSTDVSINRIEELLGQTATVEGIDHEIDSDDDAVDDDNDDETAIVTK